MLRIQAKACRIACVLLLATLAVAPAAHALEPTSASRSLATADQIFEAASQRAADLAAKPYQAPDDSLPAPFRELSYDGYRKLRPMLEGTVWGEAGNAFGVLPLPRGGLFDTRVNLFVVDAGETAALDDTARFVDFVDFPSSTESHRQGLGLSGWRAIRKPGQAGAGYEAAAFQGGTYFRATAEQLVYGASARALAIRAGLRNEEFPDFTDFWIIRPEDGESSLAFVALSDSPSAAGAYRFVLKPGHETVIDVIADIHPRIDITEAGVAPLSSMYLHGPVDHSTNRDWRSEVHDSDGLSILSASGEWIWRPLSNPGDVQISSFGGGAPQGFGLMQRRRDFAAYGDLEARYERRPSVWIEPAGNWGSGEVRLVELPTPTEYNDNIAVFWRPATPWKAGEAQRLAYTLRWNANGPDTANVAKISSTRAGVAPDAPTLRRFAIDFSGDHHFAAAASVADVWSSAGAISNIHLIDGADVGSRRLVFDFDPKGADLAELHAALRDETSQLTETWLFRWTPE
ncbi:MAG: glucan biosynthesis protein [Hyphomonadaceae bacterium]|nr:glucan biosynthesis protein [Hyphomonadaceae bacterium]